MMNIDYIRALFDYNYWANRRILDAAAGLTTEEYMRETIPGLGSPRSVLAHTVGVEALYRQRFGGESPGKGYAERFTFDDVTQLRDKWSEEEREMRAFLVGLVDADLEQIVAYRNTRGEPFAQPLWELLVHVVNHGTQHRSEVAMMLTHLGHSPGDVDFVMYMRTR